MSNFGICTNQRDNCELSCERPSLDDLPRRMAVVEAQESRGIDSQLTKSSLRHFLAFFQTGPRCSKCDCPLGFVTQPTAGLPVDSDKRRLNGCVGRTRTAVSKSSSTLSLNRTSERLLKLRAGFSGFCSGLRLPPLFWRP